MEQTRRKPRTRPEFYAYRDGAGNWFGQVLIDGVRKAQFQLGRDHNNDSAERQLRVKYQEWRTHDEA